MYHQGDKVQRIICGSWACIFSRECDFLFLRVQDIVVLDTDWPVQHWSYVCRYVYI